MWFIYILLVGNVLSLGTVRVITNQEIYYKYLKDDKIKVVISVGSAGTGKTIAACKVGVNSLKDKILITRPTISVDEDIGYLPGNINKKMSPWLKPITDILKDFNINKNYVEISPLGFMRGRTFSNYFIIADEMQNSTPNQMLMLLTRMGEGSKLVITGDLDQSDNTENGLKDLLNRLDIFYDEEDEMNRDGIAVVRFTNDDIKRSYIVKKIIRIYDNNF